MSTEPPLAGTRKIEAIVNAGSGAVQREDLLGSIEKLLGSPGANVRMTIARQGAEIPDLARKAAEGDAEVVLAAGGDGTISSIASALVGSGKILGVLPLGTFNFFSKRLGIPLDLDLAFRTVLEGRVAEVNVGEVNGRIFLNKSSVGLYPLALRHRERVYRRFGRNRLVGLISGGLAMLRRGHVMKIHVTTEAEERHFRSRFVFVCNNPQELEYFNIRGRECLDDDKLAVYLPEPLHPLRMIGMGMRLLFHRMEGASGYDALCAREMRLNMRRPRVPVSVDGEVEMFDTPLHYRMRAKALRVMVPAETKAS